MNSTKLMSETDFQKQMRSFLRRLIRAVLDGSDDIAEWIVGVVDKDVPNWMYYEFTKDDSTILLYFKQHCAEAGLALSVLQHTCAANELRKLAYRMRIQVKFVDPPPSSSQGK